MRYIVTQRLQRGFIMNFIKTNIDGVVILEPHIFPDERGYFFESYNENEFIKNGITNHFVQDNQSKSSYTIKILVKRSFL